jgi:hypothetical protein
VPPASTHRVIETCFARGAAEAWLIAGRPPLLRFAEHVRQLATLPPLAPDDIAAMVFGNLAPNLAAHFQDHGFCSFDYPCRWRDNTRVRVFVVRHGDSTFATLTPIAPDTPALRYSDDVPGEPPAR